MDQKYLTDSESLSLNIEATCLLHSSTRNFPYEIKMDNYRPYPSMISMFTSDRQQPPRSRHADHLGVAEVSKLYLVKITHVQTRPELTQHSAYIEIIIWPTFECSTFERLFLNLRLVSDNMF